jgi:flagellar biosynthesis activator protein FlaF
MQHVAKAYGAVAKEIASPRDLEANLLLKAAARLQAVHDGWGSDRSDLDGALLYNRKLWTIFLDAAMTGESQSRHVRPEANDVDHHRPQARTSPAAH